MYLLLVVLLVSFVASLGINYALINYSKRWHIKNDTDSTRWSMSAKPGIGGISFYILFLLSYFYCFLFYKISLEYWGVFVACNVAFFLGFFDDRFVLRAYTKFFWQFVCANILYFSHVYIHITPFDTLNYVFTIFWVVGIMNSINMIDNMDGISSIVSITVLAGVLYVMAIKSFALDPFSIYYTIGLLSVLGAILGFLYWNWHPSKIMMGDTGSMFLGVFLSSMSILFLWNFRDIDARGLQLKQFLIPMMLFLVPLIDTATVVFRRTLRGQGFWIGGKDHTTHHLSYLGLSDRQVALFLAFLSLISLGMVALMLWTWDHWKYWYSIFFLGYMILIFIIMQAIYERAHYLKHEKNNPSSIS